MKELKELYRSIQDTLRDEAQKCTPLGDAARSRARPYVLAVLCAGCIVLAVSVAELVTTPPSIQLLVLIGVTLVSGAAVLKIPSISVNFSISDVFTLTSAVVFGPAAGRWP